MLVCMFLLFLLQWYTIARFDRWLALASLDTARDFFSQNSARFAMGSKSGSGLVAVLFAVLSVGHGDVLLVWSRRLILC